MRIILIFLLFPLFASSQTYTSFRSKNVFIGCTIGDPSGIDEIMESDCPVLVYSCTIASNPLNSTYVFWTVPSNTTILTPATMPPEVVIPPGTIYGQGNTKIYVLFPVSEPVGGYVTVRGTSNCAIGNTSDYYLKVPSCTT